VNPCAVPRADGALLPSDRVDHDLPRPVVAHERGDLVATDLEIDAAKRLDRAEAFADPLRASTGVL
jgi:hypothetical protein